MTSNTAVERTTATVSLQRLGDEVVIRTPSRVYQVRAMRMIEHRIDLDLHRYSSRIDGVLTQIIVDCGRTPPIMSIGREKFEIDHDLQERANEIFASAEQALSSPGASNRNDSAA